MRLLPLITAQTKFGKRILLGSLWLVLLSAAATLQAQTGPFPATKWPPTINPNATVDYYIADPNANLGTPAGKAWLPSVFFAEDGDQAFQSVTFNDLPGLQSVSDFMNPADTNFMIWSNAPVIDVLVQVYGNKTLYNEDGSGRGVIFRTGALHTENPVNVGPIPPGANNGQWNWMLFSVTNAINPANGKRYVGNVPDATEPGVDYGGVNGGTLRLEGVPGINIRALAIGPAGAFGSAEQINVFAPASPEWVRAGGKTNGATANAVEETEEVKVINDVEIGTGGGRILHANIAEPGTPTASPMPAVIWIHGGAWQGGDYKDNPAAWLAKKGYFTMSIEYRLSDEAKWPAQIEDCKLAVRWLRAHAVLYHVDPEHIGCWGHSAGGHLVACLGTMGDRKEFEGHGGYEGVSSRVQAVVDFSGPADFTHGSLGIEDGTAGKDTAVLVKLFGGNFKDIPETWRKASPLANVTRDAAPFLIVHGEQDALVAIAQSERLVAALKKKRVPVEFIRVKNGGHSLRQETPGAPPADPDQHTIHAAVLAFFDKYLKNDH